MDGTFELSVDPERDLLRTRLAGFFDHMVMQRYKTARTLALRQMRCGPNQHLSLIDQRNLKIQSQDIVAAFADIMRDPGGRSRRLAIVVATSLTRMQVLRAAGDRIGKDVALFLDVEEAERWLMSQDRPAP
jgi:hypothetical protein